MNPVHSSDHQIKYYLLLEQKKKEQKKKPV